LTGPGYRLRRHHERIEQLRAGLQAAGAAKANESRSPLAKPKNGFQRP
jgi:hypothetical protein